jgi:hypothetical protein
LVEARLSLDKPMAMLVDLVKIIVVVLFFGVLDNCRVYLFVKEEPEGIIFILNIEVLEILWPELLLKGLLHVE